MTNYVLKSSYLRTGYSLSWEHVCNGLCLLDGIKGWNISLYLQSLKELFVMHITSWLNVYSMIKLFCFPSKLGQGFLDWDEIFFLIIFPQQLWWWRWIPGKSLYWADQLKICGHQKVRWEMQNYGKFSFKVFALLEY